MSKAYHLWIPRLLLLLFVLIQCTDSASVITHLPGFDGPLPFHLETGYIGVGEDETVQLFYYFIKSENNPLKDPLLLWLTGGPGCSSFTALAFEIGPLAFNIEDYNGGLPSLVSTTYSWTKEASIIFLDQPVGTGFSYSTTPLSHNPSDTGEVKQTYEFLQKWLLKHQEFVSNPFYVTGDSYSGMIIPALVQEISIGNENGYKPFINLQGYVIGNPVTDPVLDQNYRIPYAHGMGLISNELYESLTRSCNRNIVNIDPTNKNCLRLVKDYNECVSKINYVNILAPSCQNTMAEEHVEIRRRYLKGSINSNLSLTSSHCYTYRFLVASHWANDKSVQKALDVVKGSIGEWKRCDLEVPYTSDIKNSVPYHKNLSIKGYYRSLIYSGDHDLFVPFLGTQAWIASLNYSIIDKWRPWFINNQVMGYTKTYANKMTFATIKGGGHTAEYKPQESSVMFKRWIQGQPL